MPSTTQSASILGAEAMEIENSFGVALEQLEELCQRVDVPRDRGGVMIGPVEDPPVRDPEVAMRLLVLVRNIRTDLTAIEPELDRIEESVIAGYGDFISGFTKADNA